jgi:glycosyltransferase involved in cell wall biosynthesis
MMSQTATGPLVVAIPVRNEQAHIGICLAALLGQTLPADKILLLLNNCTDQTGDIVRAAAACDRRLLVAEVPLPGPRANAGEARRLALNIAAKLAGPRGVILTTDADCEVGPDWIALNLSEIAHGADVVCGMARISPEADHAVSGGLHFDLARESMYAMLLDEIVALVDPDPADPWPRHQQHSGASIAMTTSILRAAGGAPRVAAGEDRALIERCRLVDARIRHAPRIEVAVSGRLEGRAPGGMAESLRRRARHLDEETDAALEPAVDAYRRVLARARLRAVRGDEGSAESLARDLLIHPALMADALRLGPFGACWAMVERISPVLHRRRVKFVDLARETRQAIALRDLVAGHHPALSQQTGAVGGLHAR